MIEPVLDYKVLGSILRDARLAAGFSQNDVAQWFGKTYQNVSSWERGASKVDIDSLLVLCSRYGLDFVSVLTAASKEKPATDKGDGLNASEDALIKLFRLVPQENQEMVLQMIEAALKSQGLL